MEMSNTLTAIAMAGLLAVPSLSQDNADAPTAIQVAHAERGKVELIAAIKAAKENKADSAVAAENLYNAYKIAFQFGDFNLAEQMLTGAVGYGYTLRAWDNVAIAEMAARNGDLERAALFMDTALAWTKNNYCKADPNWKAFSKALKKKDTKKISAILDTKSKPALLNTYPQKFPFHRLDSAYYNSADTKYPEKTDVWLAINSKGRIRCTVMNNPKPWYGDLLISLSTRYFKPAEVDGEKVWYYGLPYVITRTQVFITNDEAESR